MERDLILRMIRKARVESPFNLPTDPPSYKKFDGLHDRYAFIMMQLLVKFFRLINKELKDDESDSSGSDGDSHRSQEQGDEGADWIADVGGHVAEPLAAGWGDEDDGADGDVVLHDEEGGDQNDNDEDGGDVADDEADPDYESDGSWEDDANGPDLHQSPIRRRLSREPSPETRAHYIYASAPEGWSPEPRPPRRSPSPSPPPRVPSPPPGAPPAPATPGTQYWLGRNREIFGMWRPGRKYGHGSSKRRNHESREDGEPERLTVRNVRPHVISSPSSSEADQDDDDDQSKCRHDYDQCRCRHRSRSPRRGDRSHSPRRDSPESSRWNRGRSRSQAIRNRAHVSRPDGEMEDGGAHSWAAVFAKLPPISGIGVPPPNLGMFRIHQEVFKLSLQESYSPRRRNRLRDYIRQTDVVFVGEQCLNNQFWPVRGDLVILPRTHMGTTATNQPRKTYITTYHGDRPGDRLFQFTGGELVLKIGHYVTFGDDRLFPVDFEYHPYTRLELYACNPMETTPRTKWRFLGHQRKLGGAKIGHSPYESPVKHLQVGNPVVSDTQIEPLVPRRGDVIIKREVWDPSFQHNVNFWYSMVKWYRDRPFPFKVGDMLVRRFIDNNYNHSSPDQNIPRDANLWGWAELYEFHDFYGWIFWGRTKLWYDFQSQIQGLYMQRHTYDHGNNSEEEIHHEMVNPRR